MFTIDTKSKYFKGWYFKCCTASQTIAFIPAFHRSRGVQTASLQIITDAQTFHVPFPNLAYDDDPLSIQIGDCRFSEKGLAIHIQSPGLIARGQLHFGPFTPIRYDIMGPFRFVPFLQCRHSVHSMAHTVNGHITVNGCDYRFQNGLGYLEGDRGRSFPGRYIWTHCFFDRGSLVLSAADVPIAGIPMAGAQFTGIIGVILLDGKEYRLATYLGARVSAIGHHTVTVTQGNFQLTATLLEKNGHPLRAPADGKMSRTIHESAACKARCCFSYKGKTLCAFTSDRASFEFEYPI